jgi:hypothetical protein
VMQTRTLAGPFMRHSTDPFGYNDMRDLKAFLDEYVPWKLIAVFAAVVLILCMVVCGC